MATATTSPPISQPLLEPEGLYEVVDGRIVEKPPMGAYEYWVAARLVRLMTLFDQAVGSGLACQEPLFLIDHARNLKRRPDAAFVSRERWPLDRRVPQTEAWEVVPDLAIEVVSPSNGAREILLKIKDYFRAGVRLVWVIYPTDSQVYVYDSPTSVRILAPGDELDGGAVLPGFRLPLTELFGGEEEAAGVEGGDPSAPGA